ncbi:hypothetical protein V1514DRAFT_323586 [Lipomyces japonicus]|uniref:uncharacterized protein n=1 Tax=Lipomyces japonicus TaxID=56871 RepID=UPI0034CDEB12
MSDSLYQGLAFTPSSKTLSTIGKRSSKAPKLSKNGVRMGRPPGTKNKPNPNGPKVGRPSLTSIFMRQQESLGSFQDGRPVLESTTAATSNDNTNSTIQLVDQLQIKINDDRRKDLNMKPYDASLRFKHGHLAKYQECRFAVIPVYSKEERQLFAETIKDQVTLAVDWHHAARSWNQHADGKSLFYKLPEHLQAYYQLLLESALSYLSAGTQSQQTELSHASLASLVFSFSVTAATIPGTGITKMSLINACGSVDHMNTDHATKASDSVAVLEPAIDRTTLLASIGNKKKGRRPNSSKLASYESYDFKVNDNGNRSLGNNIQNIIENDFQPRAGIQTARNFDDGLSFEGMYQPVDDAISLMIFGKSAHQAEDVAVFSNMIGAATSYGAAAPSSTDTNGHFLRPNANAAKNFATADHNLAATMGSYPSFYY